MGGMCCVLGISEEAIEGYVGLGGGMTGGVALPAVERLEARGKRTRVRRRLTAWTKAKESGGIIFERSKVMVFLREDSTAFIGRPEVQARTVRAICITYDSCSGLR